MRQSWCRFHHQRGFWGAGVWQQHGGTVATRVCRCHIRQNQYAEWTFFFSVCLFSPVAWCFELYFIADWVAWELWGKPALCLRPWEDARWGEYFLSLHQEARGLPGRKTLSSWVANPQGKDEKSSRSALTQGGDSVSLPLQWPSQQKLAWLALPRISSVPLCSCVSHG